MGIRDDARRATTAAILLAARREIAKHGGGGLSMRRVAREVDLVSSAVYRYFPSREALLTAMILESYEHLADALAEAEPGRWASTARALRAWATANPHEFQLIYGTPVPGYVAPPETVPAAARVAAPFLAAGAGHEVAEFTDAALRSQMREVVDATPGANPAGAAAVLAELAALVGFVGLELAGHFVGTAEPADALFEAVIRRQERTLGLA